MAEEKRLIGDDGWLASGALGTVAVTTFANGYWYKIVSKAVSASKFGDLEVGDFFYAPETVAATSGDTAYLLTLTTLVDLSGWMLELTGDEVEVTVLADKYKKYRRGKMDARGTASFTFIKGVTDLATGITNYFFDHVAITPNAGTPTITRTNRKTTALYLVGYLADEGADAVSTATILNVELYNMPLNMNSSEAVTMEIPFRLVGDLDPILYRITET